MASEALTCSIRLIERLFGEGVVAGLSDAELVHRFAATRDALAFAAIVARHGPTVMAVCQGLLGSSGDADDAFQATFLVLMNRAGTFPVGTSLGGWLCRVAQRVSRQARVANTRRRRRELAAGSRREPAVECFAERTEVIRLIRQEIDRLPERYRTPILLCDLQGLTRDEAAGLLGWPAGTVGGRLVRARKRLRDRLERRGLAPSVAVPILSEAARPAGAWHVSLDATIRSAASLAAGKAATPAVIGLAARACRGLVGVSAKVAIVAAVAAIATVAMFTARNAPATQTPSAATTTRIAVEHDPVDIPPATQTPSAATTTPASKPAAALDLDDPKLAGHFIGRVIGPDGQPVAGARLYIAPNEPFPTQAGPVRALSGADGRFEFDAPDMTFTALDGLASRRQGLLLATAAGFEPDWMVTWGQTNGSFRSHWDPVKGAEFTLQLARDDVPIQGRLLDHDGRPLAGARVRLSALQVPWKRDLDAHLRKFERSKNEVWMFDYERSLYRPVVLPGVATETFADGDGRFRFLGLGRDRLADLSVTAPSVVDTDITVMTRDAPDVVIARDSDGNATRAILGAGFTLRVQPGRTLSGTVHDRDTHQPIPGVLVGFNVLNRSKHEYGYQPATSDASGRFTITGTHPAIREEELMAVPGPGQPYLMAKARVVGQSELLFECPRGVPFQLKVVDETGMPVFAEVEYRAVTPNPYLADLLRGINYDGMFPLSRAATKSKGIYEGFVLPGPGAVLVKTRDRADYRPAHVNPRTFFGPGKSDWTPLELATAYGSHDGLIIGIGGAWVDQHEYAAIVLVNPPVASKPLELSATVMRDTPRTVTILDPEDKPVVGAQTHGLTAFPWDYEPPLRAATVPITKLHRDRGRRITFLKEDRKLIGFLLARGDGESPCTVRLKPWATVTGRILEEHGFPFAVQDPPAKFGDPKVVLSMDPRLRIETHDDPQAGDFPDAVCDGNGRFRVERLIPGLRYSARIYRDSGLFAGNAFDNLVLQPGEIRDLGDIRSKEPVDRRDQ